MQTALARVPQLGGSAKKVSEERRDFWVSAYEVSAVFESM